MWGCDRGMNNNKNKREMDAQSSYKASNINSVDTRGWLWKEFSKHRLRIFDGDDSTL